MVVVEPALMVVLAVVVAVVEDKLVLAVPEIHQVLVHLKEAPVAVDFLELIIVLVEVEVLVL